MLNRIPRGQSRGFAAESSTTLGRQEWEAIEAPIIQNSAIYRHQPHAQTNSIFVLGLYQAATQDAVEMMIYLTPIF